MVFSYKYPRPALTVDAIIIDRKEIDFQLLLVLRKHNPFAGKWALPGGFINVNETMAESCQRELEEETGLKDIKLHQFYTFDAINRDPRERTITTVFYGFTSGEPELKGGDDAADAKWFPVDSLPELAFDHKEIMNKFFRKILQV